MSDVPEKYDIIAGAWDTDIVFNTILTNKVGDGCIEFTNTTPSLDPAMEYSDFIPVEAGAPYSLFGWLQADSVTAGNVLQLLIDWYDDDQVFDSTSSAFSSVMPAANTWYRVGGIFNAPSAARYAKLRFRKNNTAFKGYFDDVTFTAMPISCRAELSSDQTVTTGSGLVKVQFASEIYDYGSVYDHATNYRFTAPVEGLYHVQNVLRVESSTTPSSGMRLYGVLHKNGIFEHYSMYEGENTAVSIGGTSHFWLGTRSDVLLLSRGDYLELFFEHTDTGTLTISSRSKFGVSRVE